MSDFDSTSTTGSDSGFRVTELFGGAMTCLLPGSFEDISQYRPVPDHQEVFVDKNSNSSIMIEILAREEDVPSSTAATYFFDDLADFNRAEGKSVVLHLPPPDGLSDVAVTSSEVTVQKCCLIGHQDVPKDHKLDNVLTFLTAFRLSPIDTDLLVTMALGPGLDTHMPAALSSALTATPAALFAGPDALTTGAAGSSVDSKTATTTSTATSTSSTTLADSANNSSSDAGSENQKNKNIDTKEEVMGSASSGKEDNSGEVQSTKNVTVGFSPMEAAFSALTRSLQVQDWSLFG
mmetsp:Transcript_10489/g.17249  ORF Transcript_10489/g.17249 Transcript_10489/m.17249 type:complete len:292 (+) Transcript_10489:131-1006(+)